jgi:hypothetical protein
MTRSLKGYPSYCLRNLLSNSRNLRKRRSFLAPNYSDFMRATTKYLQQIQEANEEFEQWKTKLPLGRLTTLQKPQYGIG